MGSVFFDARLNDQFEEEGYTSTPLLNSGEVENLIEAYYELGPPDKEGFHATIFTTDIDYRKKVDRTIKEIVGDKLDNILVNYRKLFANFMVKEPDPKSESAVHQDPSFVDESQHIGLQAWIPLTDVVEENGAVCVVPGSHHIHNYVRGFGVPDPYLNLHNKIKRKYYKTLPVKQGEALFWNHRLVHFSPPNITRTRRLAIVLCMIPNDAQAFYHRVEEEHKKERRFVHRYKIDSEFLMLRDTHDKSKPRNVECDTIVDCSFPIIKEGKLRSVAKTIQPRKDNVWEKLKRLFRG